MIWLTGDTHGHFDRVEAFCREQQTTTDDILIILGDSGFNFGGERDRFLKTRASQFPITIFSLHGNRENRPQDIPGYVEGSFHGGNILYEPQYPNLLFAVDGEVYRFAGTDCLVVGGAYSTGKEYRLVKGLGWWPDEQPSDETKRQVEALLARRGWQMPVVLTHTCPLRYKPLEALKPDLDQSTVNCTTELWMDAIASKLRYDHWFCGHFHTDKQIDNLQILFQTFVPFPSEG